MPISRRYTLALSSLAIGLLVTSCGPSKVAQCNALSAVVNKAAAEAKNTGSTPDSLAKVADSLDGFAKELEAVKLKDETLQGFQTRFVKMYKDTSKSSRDLVAAFNKKDREAGDKALKDLQAATSQESGLVDEINQYCKGSQ